MSAHTPGPWEFDGGVRVNAPAFHDDAPQFDKDGRPLSVNTTSMVALVYSPWHSRQPGGSQPANGRLIAAAPDLLAALKVTAGNIRSLGPAGALGALPEPYKVWLAVVDAAIAKAEGR